MTACGSWCRYGRCIPGRTRNTSVSGVAYLVQPDIEPVFRPERHHCSGHSARQPDPAGGRPGAADRPSADTDNDGHRRLQRRGFRIVSPLWLPFQPASGRCRWHALLADRFEGRLRAAHRYLRSQHGKKRENGKNSTLSLRRDFEGSCNPDDRPLSTQSGSWRRQLAGVKQAFKASREDIARSKVWPASPGGPIVQVSLLHT